MTQKLPPGTHDLFLIQNERQRKYVVHIPATSDSNPPVVFAFHGAGGTSRIMLYHGRWLSKSDAAGFVVIAPEGTPPDLSKKPNFRFNPQLWNLGGASTSAPVGQADDVGFVRSILEALPSIVDYDSDRVYVTGFSNGAGLTFRLAAEMGQHFAALGPISGYPTPAVPTLPLPTYYMVGELDPLIPWNGGEVTSPWTGRTSTRPAAATTLDKWGEAIGCQLPGTITEERHVHSVSYFRDGQRLMLAQRYTGLGHHWPGGKDVGVTEKIMGPLIKTSNATDLLWEFFSTQRRGQAVPISDALLQQAWAEPATPAG